MAAFYREAALILKRLEKKKGSLKSLVFSTRMKNPCISYQKKLFALTSQTLKCKDRMHVPQLTFVVHII